MVLLEQNMHHLFYHVYLDECIFHAFLLLLCDLLLCGFGILGFDYMLHLLQLLGMELKNNQNELMCLSHYALVLFSLILFFLSLHVWMLYLQGILVGSYHLTFFLLFVFFNQLIKIYFIIILFMII